MKDYMLLRIISKMLIPFILLFGLYVQMHGDYGPGGGFQAGEIFSAAFNLYAIVFEVETARRVAPMAVLDTAACIGVLLYGSVGVAGMIGGGNFLEYGALAHDTRHGNHLGITLIELGVGITVAAVMMIVYYSFAGRR